MNFKLFTFFMLLAFGNNLLAQDLSKLDASARQKLLKRFPKADLDQNGTLSETEAIQYAKLLRKQKGGKETSSNASDARPTEADVAYGPHERNKLDFWKAASEKPTPLVVFIHGGGFVSGDKAQASKDKILSACLANGISYAAINYRYRTSAPIQDVLRDCARAIQFLRSKSDTWGIDKSQVASYGGSAGAGTSLWLAFHDDLADPQNSDPVLRESTRLVCAGANAAQFSYDIAQWPEVFGEDNAKRFADRQQPFEFYGLKSLDELFQPVGEKIRADCDMRGLITKDDPPVYLACTRSGGEIQDKGAYLHHPKHSQLIYDRCCELGIPAVAELPGLGIQPSADQPTTLSDFLVKHVKVDR